MASLPGLAGPNGCPHRFTPVTCYLSGPPMRFGTRPFLDVHPLVRGLQHLVRRHPAVRPPDSEAGAHPDGPAVDPDGRDDRVPQPYGEILRVGTAEPVGEHHELVAAE